MAGIAILGSLHRKDARLASTLEDEVGSTLQRPWYDPERWTVKVHRMSRQLRLTLVMILIAYAVVTGQILLLLELLPIMIFVSKDRQ